MIRTPEQLREMLGQVETIVPEAGYQTSYEITETSCTITFKWGERRPVDAPGPSFPGLAAYGPLLVRDLLRQMVSAEVSA